MTCMFEASEGRDVAVIDLLGAFLHVDCNDHVIMRFQGRLDRLMVLAAPQIYRTYITTGSKDESILFVKLQKALHGMVKSALLFYKKTAYQSCGKRIHCEPLRPMCGYQDNPWETAYHMLACGWPKNFPPQ